MEKVIIKKLSEQEIHERGIHKWPVWTKEISTFPWYYDSTEECLILEGEILIEADNQEYTIKPGDFVVFSKGLQCVWKIIAPVRKHYNFPE